MLAPLVVAVSPRSRHRGGDCNIALTATQQRQKQALQLTHLAAVRYYLGFSVEFLQAVGDPTS